MDWKDLVKIVGPSVGAIASGARGGGQGGAASFMHGYSAETEKIRAEKESKRKEDEQKQRLGADTGLRLLSTLQAMEDPVQQQQLLDTIAKNGQAFNLPPGMFDGFTVNPSNRALVAELADRLKAVELSSKIDLDDPRVREAKITTKSGQTMTIEQAMALSGYRPVDSTGKPINAVRPPKEKVKPEAVYVRGANGDLERTQGSWNAAKGVFEDLGGNALNTEVEPEKVTTPTVSTTETERLAALGKRIRDANAKGDKVLATTLQADYDDILKARKVMGDAGRAPGGGDDALTAVQRMNAEMKLNAAWARSASSLKTMRTQMGMMNAALTEYDNSPASGQQTVIQTFNKILDDISVVRESEYARMGGGQAILDRIEAAWTRASKGGGPVTRKEMGGIAAMARAFLRNQEAFEKFQRSSYEGIIKDNGLKSMNVFGDDSLIPPNMTADFMPPTPGDTTTPTAAPPSKGNALQWLIDQKNAQGK